MPLPDNEIKVLRYLGENKTVTTGNTARYLKVSRRPALAALQGLADKGLALKDHTTFPVSWSITDFGASVLAAAGQEPR